MVTYALDIVIFEQYTRRLILTQPQYKKSQSISHDDNNTSPRPKSAKIIEEQNQQTGNNRS